MVNKYLNINFIIAYVLVPLITLAVYCWAFVAVSSWLMLEGVNYHFARRMGELVQYATIVLIIILVTGVKMRRFSSFSLYKTGQASYSLIDTLLILFPLTPITQFVIKNREILNGFDYFYSLALFAWFSLLFIFILPITLNKLMPTRILVVVGIAFVYMIANMGAMADYFSWYELGSLKVQLAVFGILAGILWLMYNLGNKKVLHLFVFINFVVSTLISLVTTNSNPAKAPLESNNLLSMVNGEKSPITRNVYLLVYDAYVPNETMKAHGIDNEAQEAYLMAQGFTLYPHTFSVGSSTVGTMSRVLNSSTDYYGNVRRGVSGDSAVNRIFDNLGYETYGLFYYDYMFRGVGIHYDHSMPESYSISSPLLFKSIILGEFRFDIERVGESQETLSQLIRKKREFLEKATRMQSFVYAHSTQPSHAQISGTCLPDEIDLFKERLNAANDEMKLDVELLVKNDPSAILIIAGDHGPYLTKNCYQTVNGGYDITEISRLDVQDRYGAFLAIRWPNPDFDNYDEIVVLQDLFPVIFSYLYKDDRILQAKIAPITLEDYVVSGVSVNNGVIFGGINDGEPLYLSNR